MNKLLLLAALVTYLISYVDAAYPPNFYNKSGCLYSYTEEGSYLITFHDGSESQKGTLSNISYNATCTKGVEPGSLELNFDPPNSGDPNMKSMQIKFQIKRSPSEGYWEVNKATLEFEPMNPSNDQFPQKIVELKPIDIYAGDKFSFSCNSLVLQNLVNTKNEPNFRLILKRFQLQPFGEPPLTVFAPSYDCAVWLTLPVIMGTILMLFITFTVIIGVYFLVQQGNQAGDLKFSKQGGMLMNQAQLDATKG